MQIPKEFTHAGNSQKYKDFIEFIDSLKPIQYQSIDFETYCFSLAKYTKTDINTIKGILNTYLYDDLLKDNSTNFVLDLNKLKEINSFYCKTLDKNIFRKSTVNNKIHPDSINKMIKNFLPLITSNEVVTRDSRGYIFNHVDLFKYNGINYSNLLYMFYYINLFESYNTITCITGLTLLNYHDNGELILPISFLNGDNNIKEVLSKMIKLK